MMKVEMEKRMAELKMEMEAGQQQLLELDEKKLALERTLLRISGAIQVLEELLASMNEENPIP